MKKVIWGQPKISSTEQKPGTYRTYREFLAKAQGLHAEQEQAQAYLLKAMPIMSALLEHNLRNREPLIVMRPLNYQTSELPEEDGFYKSTSNPKFKDVMKTIMPGTQLMLKSLDMSLQEFVFEDAAGKEHAINFADKNLLLTQTQIYENTKAFLESQND
jgi:hypothetical protein